MTLQFSVRSSYGHVRYYPANRQATALLEVVERLCLEAPALEVLRVGGFRIELIADVASVVTRRKV